MSNRSLVSVVLCLFKHNCELNARTFLIFGANVLKIALGVCSWMISTPDLGSKGADDVITSRYREGVWHEAWSTNTCPSECSRFIVDHAKVCQMRAIYLLHNIKWHMYAWKHFTIGHTMLPLSHCSHKMEKALRPTGKHCLSFREFRNARQDKTGHNNVSDVCVSHRNMPSNPFLHFWVQDAHSIKEDKIQYTNRVHDVECGVITPLCFIQRRRNVTWSSSVLQVSGRGDHHHRQCK